MGVLRTEVKSLHTCKIDRNACLFSRSKANPHRPDYLLSCQEERRGAIQGGDELNETGGTSLLKGKLGCLRLHYERFKF